MYSHHSAIKHALRLSAPITRISTCTTWSFNAVQPFVVRLASGSARSSRKARRPLPAQKKIDSPISKPKGDATTRAAILLNSLKNVKKYHPEVLRRVPQPQSAEEASQLAQQFGKDGSRVAPQPPSQNTLIEPETPQVVATEHPPTTPETRDTNQEPNEVDEKEQAILTQIAENRRQVLWPGIWTFCAVTGTYFTLAYLNTWAQHSPSSPTLDSASLSAPRATLPQSWFLTPEVIEQGLKAGWAGLDKLTIGLAVAFIAIHFTKKSPLPFWERLLHITGEKKATAFTYPLVHSSWTHVAQNIYGLCWFLPPLVHYFDNDMFHASAFLISVPLLTSFLQHFAFRWVKVDGFPLNMGASGAIAAAFGAFTALYPDEKVWAPTFLVLRLDAKYWTALFVLHQLTLMFQPLKGGNRPAAMVHLMSLGLGAAYVYLNGKDNIWRPLVRELSGAEKP